MLEEEAWSWMGDDDDCCCLDNSSREGDCRDRAEKAEVEASWAANKQVRKILRHVMVRFVGCWMLLCC